MKTTQHPLIDINTADEKLLTTSLKISLRLAKRIIAFRPYKTIDQLNQVWGVDSATLERIKTHCKIESEEPIQTIEISPSPVEPEPQL